MLRFPRRKTAYVYFVVSGTKSYTPMGIVHAEVFYPVLLNNAIFTFGHSLKDDGISFCEIGDSNISRCTRNYHRKIKIIFKLVLS